MVILIASLAIAKSDTTKADSFRIIIVPDDFPTIPEALANATAGDTVFVKAGNYEIPENWPCDLQVGNSISLVGENPRNTTIIVNTKVWGAFGWSWGIELGDNASISGFSIIGNTNILSSGNSKVTKNIINLTDPHAQGLCAIMASSGSISSNVIGSAGQGIGSNIIGVIGINTESPYNTIISNNVIDGFGTGIWVDGIQFRSNLTVVNNTLTRNNVGVAAIANPFLFKENNIVNSTGYGLYVMANVTATYNWWGTNDTKTIANSITNGLHTDSSATFMPFLASPNPNAIPIENSIIPSTSVPEFSWLTILPILLTIPIALVVVRKRGL
jgi:hypothetical protein